MMDTVAVVEDHPLTGEGIAARLSQAGFSVLAVVTAVENLHCEPSVVLCDLRLPGRSGADAIGFLTGHGHRVLATSGVARREEVLDVIANGACGFVAKVLPPAALVRAVREVAAGSFFMSAELAGFILADAERRPLPAGDIGALERTALNRFQQGDLADEVAAYLGIQRELLDGLLASIRDAAARRRRKLMPSPRERQLMRLVAEGLTHKEAASRMSITLSTVPDYLKSIKAKYLATHPEVPEYVAPLTAARKWAEELGLG
jgi:DNA-binding NarL/FixJ family response regulator